MTVFIKPILLYLLCVNLAGIAVCGIDKMKAKKHLWRIPEKTIFTIAIIGGSIGVLIGMYGFRHKTKHASFTIGVPFILLCQAALVIIAIKLMQ